MSFNKTLSLGYCDCSECEDDLYESEDNDEYPYDRFKWEEKEYQFFFPHKPQGWPTLSTQSLHRK